MTVKELQEKLSNLNPDSIIVLSADSGDENFCTCHSLSEDQLFDNNHYKIGHANLTPKLINLGYTEKNIVKNGVPCVVLWVDR